MTSPVSRRSFFAVAAIAAGAILVSRSVVELLPDGGRSGAVLRRLGAHRTPVGPDLRELGRRVTQQSPGSVRRVYDLAAARPDGPFVPIVVDAGRAEPQRAPVSIDGWLLPDLVAGIAGATYGHEEAR